MSAARLTAEFIGPPDSRIFVLMRAPAAAARGCVLIVPPFGEEMNKSRRMIAQMTRRLAERGIACVVCDFYGTGDSEGEFRDATLERWQEDLRAVVQWSAQRNHPITAVLAIRLGCALAARALAGEGSRLSRTVFWQPVTDGSRFLAQFLRLRTAASMMEPGAKETQAALRERLRLGEALEVAGYELSQAMADQLEHVKLSEAAGAHLGSVEWFEIVRDSATAIPGATAAVVASMQEHCPDVKVHGIVGEPFWSSVEIVENAELLDRTVDALAA